MHGVRVNSISAGPWASRAASAIGFIDTMIKYTSANSPCPSQSTRLTWAMPRPSSAARWPAAITGTVVYVDSGYHVMGMAVEGADTPGSPVQSH
jgi:enoyl-[acyl-carrier protein] reductase I